MKSHKSYVEKFTPQVRTILPKSEMTSKRGFRFWDCTRPGRYTIPVPTWFEFGSGKGLVDLSDGGLRSLSLPRPVDRELMWYRLEAIVLLLLAVGIIEFPRDRCGMFFKSAKLVCPAVADFEDAFDAKEFQSVMAKDFFGMFFASKTFLPPPPSPPIASAVPSVDSVSTEILLAIESRS
jgi:hypothetical protein